MDFVMRKPEILSVIVSLRVMGGARHVEESVCDERSAKFWPVWSIWLVPIVYKMHKISARDVQGGLNKILCSAGPADLGDVFAMNRVKEGRTGPRWYADPSGYRKNARTQGAEDVVSAAPASRVLRLSREMEDGACSHCRCASNCACACLHLSSVLPMCRGL